MSRTGLVSVAALGSLLLCGCQAGSSGGDSNGGDCGLPTTGTTVAPAELTDELGITEFRWSSGDSLDSVTVQLIGLGNSELGLFTLEYPNLTVNQMSNGVSINGESAAIAGPIVATLRTSDGETVRTVVTSKALPNPTLVRSDPDDPTLQIVDIDEVLATQEISYNGATLYLDERYRQLGDDVLQRRIRVTVEQAAGEPTLGRRITILEPGEDESSLPVFVEYYVLEFLDEDDTQPDVDDIAQWLDAVGLGDWQTAIPLRLSKAATLSGWQRDLGREVIRCVEGDEVATEFDEAVSARVAALNLERCAVAPISMATTFGLGLFAANPAFFGAAHLTSKLALANAVKTAAFVRQCLCLDSTGGTSNDWCGPTCDDFECNRFCNAVIPPNCSSELMSYGGLCRFDSDNLGNIPLGTCECVTSSGTVIPKGGGAPLAAQEVGQSCADPHIDTFDRRAYSPQVAGEFVLAEATSGEPLMVQVRQEPYSEGVCNGVALNTAVATQLGGANIFIDGTTQEVRIDNVAADIRVGEGVGFEDRSGFERREEATFFVYFADGSTLSIDGGFYSDITLSVPAARAGEIHGILGTPDDDPENELTLRNGTVLEYPVPWDELVTTYADSWRISQEESLFYYEPGQDTGTFAIAGFPPTPATIEDLPEGARAEAEAACTAAGVTGSVALHDCILDVGCTGLDDFVDSHLNRSEERIPISLPTQLADWTIEGPANPTEWAFFLGSAGGEDDADYTNVTAEPALLVSDREYDEFILEWVTNNTSDESEGLVGALFEYEKPLAVNGDAADDYEALLLAWSGTEPDAFASPSAPTGWTLVRLSGVVDMADVAARFYAQQSAPGYEVLATAYAPEFGWVNRTGHNVSIVYRSDRIEVTTYNNSSAETAMPLAVEASALGTEFAAGRIGLFTLGNDITRWRDVTIAPLR
jgi:hypothetical protein